MAKFTLEIEIEADSLEELYDKLSDAQVAITSHSGVGFWGWSQNGWSVEVEGESESNDDEVAEE